MKTARQLLGRNRYEHYRKLNMLPFGDYGQALYPDRDNLFHHMRDACAYRFAERKYSDFAKSNRWNAEYERVANLSITQIAMEIMAERLKEHSNEII